MDDIIAKVISLVLLIALTLLFSVVPYFLVLRGSRSVVSSARRDKVIAYLNCFAGGVFIGTFLLHLMTEGSEEFEDYAEAVGLDTDFPLFNTIVAVGFFLVAFIELFMHSCLHIEEQGGGHSHSHEHVNHEFSYEARGDGLETKEESQQGQYGSLGRRTRETDPQVNNDPSKIFNAPETDSQLEAKGLITAKQEGQRQTTVKAGERNGDPFVNASSVEVQSVGMSITINSQPPTGVRAFMLLFALSFHTIFDGLAVGLQKNSSEVWQVFTAIAIHKSIIAFCLGLEMFKCHMQKPWRAFFWLALFSLMSPIGIGLGIFLTSNAINNTAKLLSSSILQGLASGTFLYVTFLEILCVYIGHHSKGNFLCIFFAMIGCVFIALVKLLDHD